MFRVIAAATLSSIASGAHCDFGGYFRDPKHYKEGTFAGSRFVTSRTGDKESNDITIIGSDDGKNFWTIHGKQDQSRCDITVDFSPKGGPSNLSGKYEAYTKAIVWSDSNYWNQLNIPDFALGKSADAGIGGYYQDPNHIKRHSWAGTRMISDAEGDKEGDGLTLIGSDDGSNFWMLKGKFTDKAQNKLVVDFSPKGGPKELAGTFEDDAIKWSDGNSWEKMANVHGEGQLIV
eukprot:TRINITY_DN48172_c0_g1_i1.p1 TRINITY_DN48172_c0_g1~~TRINITY_DN48172_c0_g1_i1.p1  ORF type:complete len:233 (+),score=52.82 TRINITY_DN48172_c0_g1_i1:77-775(+)